MANCNWEDFAMDIPTKPENSIKGYWTDGDIIYCDTEEKAETIANFLEVVFGWTFHTGYYDPEEDNRNREVDERTGWYYVD